MDDNNKNEENKPQENRTPDRNIPGQPAPDDKYRTLKIVGIVLLVLIGIPLLIFGICVLLLM